MYTSQLYTKASKTMDFFISTLDGTFGMAKCYFTHENLSYALIEEYAAEKVFDQFKEVHATGDVLVKPVQTIHNKFIFMKIGSKQIITKRPNSFEMN